MAGTKTAAFPVRDVLHAYSSAAVTSGGTLGKFVQTFPGQVLAVTARADTAGSGATGRTIIDVLKNGVSIFGAAGDKPTITSAATGAMTNVVPATRSVKPEDYFEVKCIEIPAATGHAGVYVAVAIGMP